MESSEEQRSDVGALLFEHWMIYQQEVKHIVQQKEFAEYIGMDDKNFNHIYKGRRKVSKAVARQLAEFFDDLRFYDAAGYDRPDPHLHYVQSNWEDVPNGTKKQIAEIVAKYVGRKK
jgi:DNA-binding XRE family transcriptional regulator